MDQQFTPDLVYNLIANNPQGRAFVENLAKMNQLQQAAQQFAPQIQQFAQSPMQAMNNIGQWAQGTVNQMQQQQGQGTVNQAQQSPQSGDIQAQPTQQQNGGSQMNTNGNGMMSMAMEIVGKFENNLKEIYGVVNELKESNTALRDEVAVLTKELADARKDIGQLL